MKLILGGAYQGKTDFVQNKFGLTAKRCTADSAMTAPAINCFHLLVRELLTENRNPLQFTGELIRQNPNAIIICDEVGLGIIPLDEADRNWREAVGRCLCLITAQADYVSRILAGVEMRLK